MLRLPFVSRERYEEKCAELAALRAKYEAALSARPARDARPATPPRLPIVDQMTSAFAAVLGDDHAARAEAERIHREAFGGSL